jgi:hypothetical protein
MLLLKTDGMEDSLKKSLNHRSQTDGTWCLSFFTDVLMMFDFLTNENELGKEMDD